MLSTNFDQFNFKLITEALDFAINNKYSSFYNDKLKSIPPKNIKDYDTFSQIPFLIKDDILSYSAEDRTFVEESEVNFYAISSGTTNNKNPTIIPRNLSAERTNSALETPVKKVMMLLPPMASSLMSLIMRSPKNTILIIGDTYNLSTTSIVLKNSQISGIVTTPTILNELIKNLRHLSFNFNSIKWISLRGEYISIQKVNYFKNVFPGSKFSFGYGSSEAGKLGVRCEHLENSASVSTFHLVNGSLVEIVGEDGKTLPMGEIGEIVYTDLNRKPFPLLRYRTKDIGSLNFIECPCGSNYTLSLGGRKDIDYLKFYGITLNVQSVEKSLDSIREYIENYFQLHVYELESAGEIKPKLILHLILNKKNESKKNDPVFLETIKQKISTNLYLPGKISLDDLVIKGRFLPLELNIVQSPESNASKTKSIISHLK